MARSYLPGDPDNPFRQRIGALSGKLNGSIYNGATGHGWQEPEAPKPLPRVKLAPLIVGGALAVALTIIGMHGAVDRTDYAPAHQQQAAIEQPHVP